LDLATIGGILFSIFVITLGAALEHVTLKSLLGISAFLIVIGGSIGATILSHTVADLRQVPRGLKLAFMPPKLDYLGTIDYLISLAEKARRNGLLSLQTDAETAPTPLMRQGLTLIADGADLDTVQDTLEWMADLEAEEMKRAASVFESAGGYSPTLGIMGTVMALVTIMGNLSEPDTLGPAIAVAFLATLYGIGFANLFFLPMSTKIKRAVSEQRKLQDMVITGLLGIAAGENPRMLREKLEIHAGPEALRGRRARAPRREPIPTEASVAREGV